MEQRKHAHAAQSECTPSKSADMSELLPTSGLSSRRPFLPLTYAPAYLFPEAKRGGRSRTDPEAYFAENMVAIPPSNFCTQISIRKPYGIYKQDFKEKLLGGMAGVFSNWLTFGSIAKGT